MSVQEKDRSNTPSGTSQADSTEETEEVRREQAQKEWAEESEVNETTPAGAYPIGKSMTGGLINDDLPDGGPDDITG